MTRFKVQNVACRSDFAMGKNLPSGEGTDP